MLPAGVSDIDLSQMRNLDERDERLWETYVARLGAEPGIVITATGERDGKWLIAGLRDPLAVDPQLVLRKSSLDPDRVISQWQPYQSLDRQFVLKRAQDVLTPPATVDSGRRRRSDRGDRIGAIGLDQTCPISKRDAARRRVGPRSVATAQSRRT